ncbi:SRPBCC family protein [Streptomyces aculeolatus]|uniref:SRPBCC family protein n=1 Tax=Streptomyces aculeolatus TaxID=270689 RepID=UPI001CED8EEF|nr:SRPBCC family protein [Streptomyces aculeolatus]
MTTRDNPVVRRQTVVAAPLEKAFTAFTERFGDFKPPEHNLLGKPIAETVFEPRVGGHIYDRAEDGSECRWARVLAYEPPVRVVFSWDIGPSWQLEADPENASEVEVRFVAETPDRTRVELEHRGIERHGPGWRSVADGVGSDDGWPLYLDRFAALLGPQAA